MLLKFTASILAYTLLAGCIHYKTPEEFEAESKQWQISNLRSQGMNEADIKRVMDYSALPYKKQLESRVSSSSTPTNNFLALMDQSHQNCQSKRSILRLPSASLYDNSNRKSAIIDCAFDSKSVVRSYYTSYYSKSPAEDNKDKLIKEAYLNWQSYMDALTTSTSDNVTDDQSLKFSTALRRVQMAY